MIDLAAQRLLPLARSEAGFETRATLAWFQLFLLVHVAARTFLTTSFSPARPGLEDALAAATIGVAALGLAPAWRRSALTGVAVLVFGQLVAKIASGLDTANHVFLEGVFLGFCAVGSLDDEDECELVLQALRCTIALFFFWTGLQKVLHGYYFDGQYLTYAAATSERFHFVFQHLLPAEELARLQAFNGAEVRPGAFQPVVGAGPYRPDSPLFVVMSNAVYLFEMGAGLLLLVPGWRVFAAVAAIGFVLAIEAGARELSFGILMINLLLLFVPGNWVRRSLPLWLVGYGYLVLAEGGGFGWLPMFSFRA